MNLQKTSPGSPIQGPEATSSCIQGPRENNYMSCTYTHIPLPTYTCNHIQDIFCVWLPGIRITSSLIICSSLCEVDGYGFQEPLLSFLAHFLLYPFFVQYFSSFVHVLFTFLALFYYIFIFLVTKFRCFVCSVLAFPTCSFHYFGYLSSFRISFLSVFSIS